MRTEEGAPRKKVKKEGQSETQQRGIGCRFALGALHLPGCSRNPNLLHTVQQTQEAELLSKETQLALLRLMESCYRQLRGRKERKYPHQISHLNCLKCQGSTGEEHMPGREIRAFNEKGMRGAPVLSTVEDI